MAAVTETNRQETVTSNQRVVEATAACAATGDTWDSGLGQITTLSVVPTTNLGDTYASYSGGVVTLGYSGGGAGTFTVHAVGS